MTLEFGLLFEILTLLIILLTMRAKALIFLRHYLSMGANIFDPVTLTLGFGLLFENFNLVNNFSTMIARVFIFHMNILRDKIFWCQVTSYKDHFEQKPLRTRVTISYKSIGVTSNKDFLYVVVPRTKNPCSK